MTGNNQGNTDRQQGGPAVVAREWRIRLILAGIGLVQGVCLFVLTQYGRTWLGMAAPREAITLLVLVAPPTFYLCYAGKRWVAAASFSAGIAAVLALLHFWTMFPAADGPSRSGNGLSIALASAFVVIFVATPFFQVWMEQRQWRFPYERLFDHSWNNGLELIAAGVFTATLWLLLLLWAALFRMVNISFFGDVFAASWFVWPVSGMAAGFGVAAFREQERVLRSMRALVFALIDALAPVLPTAAILFLLLLPFAGLETLWRTGFATAILLTVIGIAVILANTLARDGAAGPAPSRVSLWPVSLLMVLSPVFTVFAFYATIARIVQYGLSPERFYALLLIAIAGLYAVVYAYAVLRHRSGWGQAIRHYNPALAALTAVAALLIMSPLADSRRISAYAQYYRLTEGYIDAAAFDYGYLKYRLGPPGRRALERIRADSGRADREQVRKRLAALDATRTYPEWLTAQREFEAIRIAREFGLLVDYLLVLPEGTRLPDGVERLLVNDRPELLKWCHARPFDRCAIVVADLSGDPSPEIVIARHWNRRHVEFEAYRRAKDGWRAYDRWSAPADRAQAIWTAMKENKILVVPPAHRVLRIGEDTVPIEPRR